MTEESKYITHTADDMKGLEPLGDTPIAPAHGIAAIALNMALKYHDIATVQDGTLYQQYKLEGKNMTPLHLDMVFETAIAMEKYLLGASERIAKIVVDAITDSVDDNLVRDKPDDTPCSHKPMIGFDNVWRCQICGDVVDMKEHPPQEDDPNLPDAPPSDSHG